MHYLRIKVLMKALKISGKELAERVQVSENTISSIANEKTQPRFELLEKIANALDVDIKDLFYSTKEGKKQPVYIEENGTYTKIGELDLNRLDEGSVPGSDEEIIN